MTAPITAPDVVGVEEVAAFLGISARHVRRLCKQRVIPATLVGVGTHAVWVIPRAWILPAA